MRALSLGLKDHGIEVIFDHEMRPYGAILLVGGTRHLGWLWQCKRRGIPIIQRLGPINWVHKYEKVTSKARWMGGLRNWNVGFVRRHLADHVVYQSNFSKGWWDSSYGATPVECSTIHNGVDTRLFTPSGESVHDRNSISLVAVEGNLAYVRQVLMTSLQTWKRVAEDHPRCTLLLVGDLTESWRTMLPNDPRVMYAGPLPHEQVPAYLRGATAFISAEINPACPNSVIEALACGTPVVGFATGALREIVTEGAGVLADYGADPWKLEPPDIDALVTAVEKVRSSYDRFSAEARKVALERFSTQKMANAYAQVIRNAVGRS